MNTKISVDDIIKDIHEAVDSITHNLKWNTENEKQLFAYQLKSSILSLALMNFSPAERQVIQNERSKL